MTRLARPLALLITAVVICAGAAFLLWPTDEATTLTGRSDQHTVQLKLKELTTGPVEFDLTVVEGSTTQLDAITLEPGMPGMGHATAPLTAQRGADGHYRGRGELFAMPGTWELTVRLGADTITITASVKS
ncbi:FixH family protein [Kribbella sp. NPDC056345]|uniref:FixH family protein n=1 Tax=Kribbella sp. NPDC056345 TaxID=3345789 RepID=UPI0035D6C88F